MYLVIPPDKGRQWRARLHLEGEEAAWHRDNQAAIAILEKGVQNQSFKSYRSRSSSFVIIFRWKRDFSD
ncbi:hypothetical protein COOONC_24240 [Cooperia oncophora]